MNPPAFKKIVIIGLGLMGGSLAAAIRKKFPSCEVVGVARRDLTLKTALRKKWIHAGFLDAQLKSALDRADLVVLCTPVDLIPRYLKEIDRLVARPVVVTDIGSVQASDADYLKATHKKKWNFVQFTGAHPMVGSHERGIEAARPNLYENGLTLITGKKSKAGFDTVCFFWKKISREVRVLPPSEHNALVAQISHLSHLLSVCLAQTPTAEAYAIAGAGFKDTTRLAEGDASVWAPIFQQNKREVLKAVRSFNSNLDQFEAALKSKNPARLVNLLKRAASRRSTLR